MWRTSFCMTDLLVAQPVGHLHLRELKELSDTLIQIWKKIPRTPSIVTLGACSNNLIPRATHGGEHIMFCSCHPTSDPGFVQGRTFSISTTSFQLLISQNYNFRNQHIIRVSISLSLFCLSTRGLYIPVFLHVQLFLFSLDLPLGSLFLLFGFCECTGNFSN